MSSESKTNTRDNRQIATDREVHTGHETSLGIMVSSNPVLPNHCQTFQKLHSNGSFKEELQEDHEVALWKFTESCAGTEESMNDNMDKS